MSGIIIINRSGNSTSSPDWQHLGDYKMFTPSNPRSMTFEQREEYRTQLLNNDTVTRTYTSHGDNEDYAVYCFNMNIRGEYRPCLLAFKGKSLKPVIYNRYRSENRRDKEADNFINSVMQSKKNKEARKASKKQKHTLEVGDVLRASWGYDQTNIDYYEVVALNGKTMVTVRPIEQEREHDLWMQGSCTPKPGHYIGDPMRRRVNGQNNSVRVNECAHAFKVEPIAKAGQASIYKAERWTSYA